MATCTCPGWALGLHLQLQSKQRLVTVEKASLRHSGILIREKSLAAIGSGEHRLSVLLNAPSGAWSCPDAPRSLCGTLQPLGTTASLSLCCPTWYRSQQRLLDNVAADDHPMQTSRQVRRSRKGLFLVFFFLFPCFFKMATSSSILNARSRLQPPRRPPGTAALLCQKCRPSGYCYLRKHLQIFQGWDLRLAGNACPVAFLHGFPSLQRKQQMILMDHSG